METYDCIKKYMKFIETDKFEKYEKDFASKIQHGLFNAYRKGLYEPDIVSIIESIINQLNELSPSNEKFGISTNSVFIHGTKSQVKFEYYGQETQRELGDLIFIISIIYNNRKYFEKFTITQFKKTEEEQRWYFNKKDDKDKYSDKEQLYLLSRFPSFRGGGKGSIIPMKEYNLPNYSGCLGSHGLLYYPGDFVFVSSKKLEFLLGNDRSIAMKDTISLYNLEENKMFYSYPYSFPYCEDIDKLLYICHKLYRYHNEKHFLPYPFITSRLIPILNNSHYSPNVYEFTDKYLRASIGELIFGYGISYNNQAFQFLQDLMMAIRKKAEIEIRNKTKIEKNERILNFVKSFYKFSYKEKEYERESINEFDYEGGDIGIIHTSINLGGE